MNEKTKLGLMCLLLFLFIVLVLFLSWKQGDMSQFDMPDTGTTRVLFSPTPAPSPTPPPIAHFKEERSAAFSALENALTALSQASDENIRKQAEQALLTFCENQSISMNVESALAGMGMTDAVCIYQDGQISLFTAQSFSDRQVSALFDAITAWTSCTKDDIHIITLP